MAMLSPRLLRQPVHLLALGFGTGLSVRAPGTFGTLIGVLFYLALQHLPLVYYIGITLVLFLLGIWICGWSARELGVHDHPAIVWDEIVGYLVTMIAAPAGWAWIVLGFLLFRLFDIWKPWPIRWLDQRIQGGLGIMIDDIIAGIFALIVMQLLHIFPQVS
jgi:phosphatidylglycerophosphatase A